MSLFRHRLRGRNMKRVPLFTWWRLMLLSVIIASGSLWVRSYYRADGLNLRTAAQTHFDLRVQSGALVFEILDESGGAGQPGAPPPGLSYVAPDGVCDTRTWNHLYIPHARVDLLGFIWIKGSYLENVQDPAPPPPSNPIELPSNGLFYFFAHAQAVAIPFWFLLSVPALIFAWLLFLAIRNRRRGIAGN
jgi:hypothetical protein